MNHDTGTRGYQTVNLDFHKKKMNNMYLFFAWAMVIFMLFASETDISGGGNDKNKLGFTCIFYI